LPLVVGVLANIETNKHSIYPNVRMQPGVIGILNQWSVRLTFYYLDAEMVQSGVKEPIPVTPKIVEAKDAPSIPPLGWQFANKTEFGPANSPINRHGVYGRHKSSGTENRRTALTSSSSLVTNYGKES